MTTHQNVITDSDAWIAYPHHHNWFDKLYIAELMGYECGPCGVAPKTSGVYVVRPIYNLAGMGVGARVDEIASGDYSKVPPGYFWCEYICGKHYSVTYKYDNESSKWIPTSCWEGVNAPNDLSRFYEWKRSTHYPTLPKTFDVLSDVGTINVEFKGDNPIEVHLRESPDPKYDHIVPTWGGNDHWTVEDDYFDCNGYTWIPSIDDAYGFLKVPRTGFWCK